MPTEPKLSDLQAWLHTFVVAPGTPEQAIASAEQRAGFTSGSAESLILPSPTLSPRERIQIYRNMYLLRMQEALEIDFPTLKWYLGSPAFKELVASYVESYPSQSYTLDHLGSHLSSFLRERDWGAKGCMLGDLAELEWSLCVVALAHDSPTIKMVDLASVAEDRFLDLQFQSISALQILELQYAVNDMVKAANTEQEPFTAAELPNTMVVWRHELKVWRMGLNPIQHEFLRQLCQGKTLGQAIDFTLEENDEDEENLFSWFQEWLSEGFFSNFIIAKEIS